MGKWSFILPLAFAEAFVINHEGFTVDGAVAIAVVYTIAWLAAKAIYSAITGGKKK